MTRHARSVAQSGDIRYPEHSAFLSHPCPTGTPVQHTSSPRDVSPSGGLVIPRKGNDMHNRTAGMRSQPISQRMLLEAFQQDEQFVYAVITRENAVKIGVSVNLANRKSGIKFGGVDRFVGFMPGGFPEERRIHAGLSEFRIYGTNEYYYPLPGVLPAINAMREWMGIRPLRRRDLPRPASCTFHGRVLAAEHRTA